MHLPVPKVKVPRTGELPETRHQRRHYRDFPAAEMEKRIISDPDVPIDDESIYAAHYGNNKFNLHPSFQDARYVRPKVDPNSTDVDTPLVCVSPFFFSLPPKAVYFFFFSSLPPKAVYFFLFLLFSSSYPYRRRRCPSFRLLPSFLSFLYSF
ncbi:hypothetical protein BDR26DRAFT_921003, partial [Obelidium mucronatum]